MMRLISFLFVLAFSVQLSGQSRLTRSQKKIKESIVVRNKDAADAYLKVDLVSNNRAELFSVVSKDVAKTIFDLTDKGQKALIESLNHKTKTSEELIGSLKSELSSSITSTPAYVKKTAYLKTIEIDVRDMLRGTERVGRIDALVFRIKLPDNNVIKFKSLNNISTKYDYINFGEIGLTRNQSFTFNAGVEFGGTGSTTTTDNKTETKQLVIGDDTIDIEDVSGGSNEAGTSNKSNLGVTYTAGRTITEETEVKRRRIALKGNVGTHEIMIYQEGAPQLNLNDKITIEIVFEVTDVVPALVFNFENLFDEDHKPVTDSSRHRLTPYYLVMAADGIFDSIVNINLEYEFVYREILNNRGKDSPGEWDDKIKYVKLVDPSIVSTPHTLICKDELKYGEWYIADGLEKQYLGIDFYGSSTDLKFYSLDDVFKLLRWIKESQSVKFGNFRFILYKDNSQKYLTKADIKNLDMFKVGRIE